MDVKNVNKTCKPYRNNSDPVSFVEINKEPMLNETEAGAVQNNNRIDLILNGTSLTNAAIQQDINQNIVSNRATSSADTATSKSKLNQTEIKQEDFL